PVWLVVLAVVALLLLVVNIALNVSSYHQQRSHSQAAARSSQATAAYEKLLSLISDAESGQRGYLLTGDESHLGRYDVALRQIAGQTESLKRLAGPAPPAEDLRQLEALVGERLEELSRIIASYDEEGLEAARLELGANFDRKTMDRLRETVD